MDSKLSSWAQDPFIIKIHPHTKYLRLVTWAQVLNETHLSLVKLLGLSCVEWFTIKFFLQWKKWLRREKWIYSGFKLMFVVPTTRNQKAKTSVCLKLRGSIQNSQTKLKPQIHGRILVETTNCLMDMNETQHCCGSPVFCRKACPARDSNGPFEQKLFRQSLAQVLTTTDVTMTFKING